jgi:hypothetical protein
MDTLELIDKYYKKIDAAKENIALYEARIKELNELYEREKALVEETAAKEAAKTKPLSDFMSDDEQNTAGTSD